jgi:general secretion pathway protein A
MYLNYWNLREAPFQNVADPRFAYLSDQHHEGLARLVYLAQNRKLGGVLVGPYGVGKSMVLELLAQQVRRDKQSRYIGVDYLPGRPAGFARDLLMQLGFKDHVASLEDPNDALILLRDSADTLGHTVLTVDEAQTITSPEVYHFLQLMMNLSIRGRDAAPVHPAFTLILSGYTDMTDLLSQDESLCQRLQMVWKLEPLAPSQVTEYIQHRVRVAGGDIWIFEQEAIEELGVTRGIPRLINNVCDTALMLGYAANARSIGPGLMRQAIQEADASARYFSGRRESTGDRV